MRLGRLGHGVDEEHVIVEVDGEELLEIARSPAGPADNRGLLLTLQRLKQRLSLACAAVVAQHDNAAGTLVGLNGHKPLVGQQGRLPHEARLGKLFDAVDLSALLFLRPALQTRLLLNAGYHAVAVALRVQAVQTHIAHEVGERLGRVDKERQKRLDALEGAALAMAQVEHELVGAAQQPLVLKHNAGNRIGILERVDAHVHGLVILGLAVQHRLHLGQGTGVQGVMVGLDIETSTGRCALDLEGLGVMQEEAPVLALGRHAKQRAATLVVAIGADRLAVDGKDAVAFAQAVVIPHLIDKQAVLRGACGKAHVPVVARV